MKNYSAVVVKLAAASFLVPTLAQASMYQNFEQSAMGAGMAHADMAAGALDASTAYYNPAGMSFLEDAQLSVGGVYLNQRTELYDVSHTVSGSTTPVTDLYSTYDYVLPNVHIVYPFKNVPFEPRFGLSFVMPARESSFYHGADTSPYATETSQEALLFNPSLSAEVIDGLSIGAGIDMQQMVSEYNFKNLVVDFVQPNPDPPGPPIHTIINYNGNTEVSDWSTGWNVGLMYEVLEDTRLGATFRSKIGFDQEGTLKLGAPGSSGLHYDAYSEIISPATTTFGIYQDIGDRLGLAFTAAFMKWDDLDEISVYSPATDGSFVAPGAVFDFNVPLELENSWFFSVGGEYELDEEWIARAGFSYDQTPLPEEYNNMRFTDADRYTFALGLGYELSDSLQIDASYEFVYSPTRDFNNPDYAGFEEALVNPTGELDGQARMYSNRVGLQLTWAFLGGELED